MKCEMCGISGGVLGLFIWGVWVKKWLKNPKIGFVCIVTMGKLGFKWEFGGFWDENPGGIRVEKS